MRSPSLPYVLPFLVFLALLGVEDYLPFSKDFEYPLRVALLSGLLWYLSRNVIDFRVKDWAGTIAIGIGVFLVWIGPDLLWPGYRESWVFQNGLTGSASTVDYGSLSSFALAFRTVRAVVLVPIIEELFWRAWLLRWLISPKFEQVQLGTWSAQAFWITALLFASEHGRFWDVGLVAGIAYNLWMMRTKSLGDCILAHAVSNAMLSAYVLTTGKWRYW